MKDREMAGTDPKRDTRRASPRKASAVDEALIERVANGDETALRALIDRHQPRLSRYVLRFLRDHSLVDDVLGETFFAVWRQAATFERRSSVATWLSAIARYTALSHSERKTLAVEPLSQVHAASLADSRPHPDAVIEGREMLSLLRQSLLDLPPEQAVVFDLAYFRDKSIQEIASITGAPKNTIKWRMFRARRQLAAALGMADNDCADIVRAA